MTLRRKLLIGVCGVVMVVLLIVGLVTIATLRGSVNQMVASQLSGSADAFSNTVNKIRATLNLVGSDAPTAPMKPLTEFVGQAPGNLIVLLRDGRVVDSALFSDGDAVRVPDDVIRAIEGASLTPGVPHSMELPGLQDYRVSAVAGEGGEVFVSGVSEEWSDYVIGRARVIVVALTIVALLLTAAGTVVILRVALRPLARVAATASEVATLPLGRDQHAITVRVPEADTNPRTEVGLVGDTLNRLLAHVERELAERAATDRRMRQFVTDASHELRTPLAAIQGYAELTRQDSAVLPETTEYSLARIEAEAKRMNSLVADLLLLARLDEGQDMDAADVDLVDIVVDAVNDAAVSAPSHEWRKELPDGPIWVRGDHARLHQLLVNLLSNARIHTPGGTTVTTALAMRRTPRGATAELSVADNGPGIDAALVPHLFERFVRADKSRSRQSGNSGLGLAIVASIVEAHRGTVSAESHRGRTTFRVELPLIDPVAAHSNPAGAPLVDMSVPRARG